MQELGKSATPLQRSIGSWAKKTGLEHNLKKLESGDEAEYSRGHKISYPVAKKFVFSKVKQKLGLDRCRWICGGGAPFSRETLEYFLSLDIKLFEMYGLSETCGPHTGNHPALHKFETVGPSITGCRTKIHEPDNGTGQGKYSCQMQYFHHFLVPKNSTYNDVWYLSLNNLISSFSGEVCMSSRNVMMGYLFCPDKTKEAIDKEGWLHSGNSYVPQIKT